MIGRQAAPGGPLAEPLNRLAGRFRDVNDVAGRLDQRDVEQSRQATTTPDLGAGPVTVEGPTLGGVEAEPLQVHPPDRLFLGRAGKVEKVDCIEALGATELGWQLGDVVASADEESV